MTTTTTTPTPSELLTAALALDAELQVLGLYDDQRHALGYDFGNGQRAHELIRVRRERDHYRELARIYVSDSLDATPAQQRAAFKRLSKRRLARYDRARERDRELSERLGLQLGHVDRTERLARKAWERVDREISSIERSAS